VVFGVIALGSLLAQIAVPFVAADVGRQFPEVSHLVAPYSSVAIVAIGLFEAILLAVWRLLNMVSHDRIFTESALRWVKFIPACAGVASALCIGVWFHLIFIEKVGGPSAFFGLAACAVGWAAFALVMVVMRGVLQAATTDRRELAGVI
jgi:hypothetical protein